MGLFDYRQKEHNLLKGLYAEANNLFGVECIYYAPKSVDKDSANDPFIVLDEGTNVNVVFETHPKTVLKSLNWYAYDNSILPLVAYISEVKMDKTDKEPIDIRQYGRLKIPYVMKDTGTQLFQIDKVQGDTLNPLIWTCSLVPCAEQTDYNPETPEIEDTQNKNDSDFGFGHIKW